MQALSGPRSDEFVSTELGQVGAQFDGPGHIGVKTSRGHFLCNGHVLEDDPIINAYGLGLLGVEHVADIGFVCRGVLLDAVKYRQGQEGFDGVRLQALAADDSEPGVINQADIEQMVADQGADPIADGDCVFLYTGHGE
ncbi:unnamed protein product [Chrysoparadoxa australica]